MRTAVRFLMAAHLRDLSLWLARSFARDLKWRGVHSKGRAVVKEGVGLSPAQGLRQMHCYVEPEFLYTVFAPITKLILANLSTKREFKVLP